MITGVVVTVFVQEEFVIAIQGFMVKIVVNHNVQLGNIGIKRLQHVLPNAPLVHIKMIIRKLVNFVKDVNNVEINPISVQDVYRQMLILYISISMMPFASQNAPNILIGEEISVLIVIIQQGYYAKPAVKLLLIVHPATRPRDKINIF